MKKKVKPIMDKEMEEELINEVLDSLEIQDPTEEEIKKLKEENKRLKRRIWELEFRRLPKEEQRWAENAYLLLWGKLFWSDILDFYWKYLDYTEDDKMPF